MYGVFFFQAEDGIRDLVRSRGLGDVYKRQHTYHSLVDLLPEDQRAFEDVWDIVIYGQDVFFRTNHVVFQYSGGKMIIHKPMGSLLSMFVTREGLCIQTVAYDLLVFKKGSFQPFLKVDGLQSAITGALAWDGDTVILSSLKQGLFYLANGRIGRWTTLYDDLIKEKRVYSSTTLPNGNLALGTSLDGLIVIDSQRRVIRHLNKKSGLQNNNILHTFSDRAGNVWLGLDNGIDCVVLDSRYTSIFPDGEMQATGYSASVFENRLYLGVSNGAYVAPWQSYYDPELGPVFKKVNGTDGQVWSLNPAGGALVMGHHEGSFLLSANNSRLLSSEPGAWTFVTMSDEYMLGGTYTGLVLYRKEKGQWVFDRKLDGLKESCRIMVKDEDQSIWISHPYRGVYNVRWNAENKDKIDIRFFNQEDGLPTNLNNYVFQIAGKAVFATEKGVFHFDRSKDTFVPDDDFNRLLDKQHRVRYLREDTKGNVWYVTDHEAGMLIVNDFGLKKEVRKKVIPELAGKLVGGFEFLLPIDGHNMIIGTEQGFIHYALDEEDQSDTCLLYTSDAADERSSVDLGGRRIIKKKKAPRPGDTGHRDNGQDGVTIAVTSTCINIRTWNESMSKHSVGRCVVLMKKQP